MRRPNAIGFGENMNTKDLPTQLQAKVCAQITG